MPATSYVVIACTARDRYFDLDAVRTENKPRGGDSTARAKTVHGDGVESTDNRGPFTHTGNPAGAPPLDWFHLPADQLSELLIKAMLPRRVCRVCGQPS